MGYTTEFSGSFTLDKPLSWEHAAILRGLHDLERGDLDGAPDAYCQWVPTRDRRGIEWDGGEKFYKYTEWLQFIIDKYLKTWGYRVSGSVDYSGESSDDIGCLEIADNKVSRRAAAGGVEPWKRVNEDDRAYVIKRLAEEAGKWKPCARKSALFAAVAALSSLRE